MQSRKAVGPALSKLEIVPKPSDRFAYQNRFVPFIIKDADGKTVISVVQQFMNKILVTDPSLNQEIRGKEKIKPEDSRERENRPVVARPGDDIEAGMSASDFGVVLLERTRITPAGFALGEHLLSLSLAPGEEVTIEQKAYSERTVTYEDVSDTDEQVDTEVGSSLTTELSVALSQAVTDTKNKGFNAGATVGYGGFSTSGGYADSINSAMTQTQAETVRNTVNQTQKLTARRRAQHKISVKVSETSKFETGNKRVLRNPNQFTPIDLVYFKILQKVDLSHERFGVRLCWAPFVRDPGVVLDEALRSARQNIESQIPLNLPPEPPPPPLPAGSKSYKKSSGTQELTKWGIPNDMSADYEFEISPDAGFTWDGDESVITSTLNSNHTGNWGPHRGDPQPEVVRTEPSAGGVKVLIHMGIREDWNRPHFYIEFKARFVTDTAAADADYQKKLGEWQTQHDIWVKEVSQNRADRTAKVEAMLEEWKKNYTKTFDPISAGFQLLIAHLFPPEAHEAHDEGFEVEMWNKIFDFAQAAFQYYPSWWSGEERRNPGKPPDSFENASWMRVFLPIRPGFEEQALNLIIGRRVYTKPTDPLIANAITKVLKDLTTARDTYFGGVDEIKIIPGTPCPGIETPYICLGHWNDLLPTDGTHLEVVQAKTTAVDDTNEQSLNDAHTMITARISNQQSEGQLTTSVKDRVTTSTEPPDVDVTIGIGSNKPE